MRSDPRGATTATDGLVLATGPVAACPLIAVTGSAFRRVCGRVSQAGATMRAEDLRALRLLEQRLGADFAAGIMLCTVAQPRQLGGRVWTLPSV